VSINLQDLERPLAALEAQCGQQGNDPSGGGAGPADPQLQSFLQGALTAYAMAHQQDSQSLPTGGGGSPLGGGWNPTQYDSFWWCKSRLFCNQQSLSCLC